MPDTNSPIFPTGYFNSKGSPCIKISISGVFNPGKEFEVIIDTGFSGFISMPMLKAFPLGLPLFGTTNITLADASTTPRLTAIGRAAFNNANEAGVIILEPQSADILVGMDFLRTFKLGLWTGKSEIILMAESTVDNLKAVVDRGKQQAKVTPTTTKTDPA